MDTFDLILDSIAPIDESDLVSITGSIVGLDVPGGEVSLTIDFGDLSTPAPASLISVRDDGSGADQTADDGTIQFDIETQYFDDDPSVTPSDVYQLTVDAREQVLAGTDAVFVIDVSPSAEWPSGSDFDGDGTVDSVLAGEIAAFKALNQDLIDRGLGDIAKVSIAAYGGTASLRDLDPTLAGTKTFTTPNADLDGNGVRDVDQALDSLTIVNATNFQAGLQQAKEAISQAGTAPGQGSVIFLSDGTRNRGTDGVAESEEITGVLGQSLRAFGVGSGSELAQLQQLDPNAERFTDIGDLLNLFSGTGSNVNQDSDRQNVRINNVAPDVTLANPRNVTEDSEFTLDGSFTDVGSLDTFDIDVDWGDGTVSSFDVDAIASLTVGTTLSSSSDGSTLTITNLNTSTGKVSFSADHTYTSAGDVNISLSVTDDDSGSGSQSAQVTVRPGNTGGGNQAPNAANDIATTDEDTVLRIATDTLLANDSDVDGDALTITAVNSDRTAGTVSLNGNRIVYNPIGQFDSLNDGDTATDRFTYTVSDGTTTDTATVTVTVNGVGDDPNPPTNSGPNAVADTATTDEDTALTISAATLLANDSDPDGDALTITSVRSNGNQGSVSLNGDRIVFDPNGQFESLNDGETATARFTYTVSDGSKTATAPVTVTVTGVTDDGSGDKKGATILGTGGEDRLIGTHDGETIRGRSGKDTINGRNGDDCLIGGRGNDTMNGGLGNDVLNGGDGQDVLSGGRGNDVLRGFKSNDSLAGGGGDDRLNGGVGKDALAGGAGSDRLTGGLGDDTLQGDGGDDILNGGKGRDTLSGGKGKDRLKGGLGRDVFVLTAGEGLDTIVDFNRHVDKIALSGGLTFGSLSFSGNQIIDTASSSVLAELSGVDTTTLGAGLFQTV